MTKQQKNQIDNLYQFSNQPSNFIDEEKINKKKAKEREKRIKQRKAEKQNQFDLDTETVVGMTNRNNQNKQREKQKKISKKQAQIERKKKKIKRIIKFTTLLLILIGGVVFALVSPIFNIKEISVINNNQIATETIISLSQLQLGQNIFKFNQNQVEKEIKTNPYIENVEIKRKLLNKIEISIKEREKNYNIEFLNGYAYINNQGYILEISEQKIDLPTIQGVLTEPENIVAGNRLNIEDLEKLETVIQIINICKDYELDKKVSTINITDKNNYILYLEEEKKEIHLGDNRNLTNKMLYVPAILQESAGKKGTIYVDGNINNNFKPRFFESVDV